MRSTDSGFVRNGSLNDHLKPSPFVEVTRMSNLFGVDTDATEKNDTSGYGEGHKKERLTTR